MTPFDNFKGNALIYPHRSIASIIELKLTFQFINWEIVHLLELLIDSLFHFLIL